MWARVISVSRRGFPRIYGFLTGSRMSGSATKAARVPSQGSLDPNSVRQFSPLPPRGEGVCRPSPLASHRRGDGTDLSTTSSRRWRAALPLVRMLLQQYSLDHKSGHACGG